MGTNIISLSYIFTPTLWGNDFQTGFKYEDVEAWQPSDIIKAPQSTRQSRNKLWVTMTLGLHSYRSVLLLNGFLGIFTHCKFSPDFPFLINQHCTLRQRHIKWNLHGYKAWHYFANMLSGVYTQNMFQGRMETNRIEPKHTDVKACLVFQSLLRCASKYYWQSQESSNIIYLQSYFVYTNIQLFPIKKH